MAALRKLQRPARGALARPDSVDPEIAAKFPVLHDHLTRTIDDDGESRQVCSLTIYAHQGRFRGFLNDRDSLASLGVDGDTLQGVLKALEAELESDQPSWFWRQGAEGKGGRKPDKRS